MKKQEKWDMYLAVYWWWDVPQAGMLLMAHTQVISTRMVVHRFLG